MLELDKVDRAVFAEFVDQDFEIALKNATLNVRLVEVDSLGAARAGNREPFALRFRVPPTDLCVFRNRFTRRVIVS